MNSSGIKRGLAISAISALSIAGIPALASPASAESVNDQVGANVVDLFNTAGTPLSIKPDGTDSTIRLEAGAGANFTSVTFQYQLVGGAFQEIATVQRNDDGAFSFEWTPPTNIVSQPIVLRAIATPTAGGTAVSDTATTVVSNSAESVNLTSGSAKGVFDTPYTGATGTGVGQNVRLDGTASVAGPVALDDTNPDTANSASTATAVVPTGGTTAVFEGVIDVTGYNFAGADELVASATTDSEDFEAYTLYNQVITTVTATANNTNVPTGQNANITVTVVDQNGAPIVGAEVRNGAGTLVGYTDVDGQVPTTQGPSTTFYYANATDNDPFVAAEGDKRSADVAITSFTPVVTSLVATSRDGAAFDFDENIAGDIIVQAKDQFGNNVDVPDAQDLSYYFVLTPFDGSPSTVRLPATGSDTVTADNNGAFIIPKLPTSESGTFELFAGLTDDPATPADESTPQTSKLVVRAGQAALSFTGSNPQSAPAGGSSTVNGRLLLEDGTTGLGGRSVALTYAQGTVGSDPAKDAGFTDGNDPGTAPDPAVTVTTGADGGFSATVVDPAETPQGTETGGRVTANTANGTVDNDNPAAAPATRDVNFVSTVAPATATVVIDAIGGTPAPGELVTGRARVTTDTNNDGIRENLAGQQVTLTLPAGSGAYFTNSPDSPPNPLNNDGTPASAPVVGADAGTYNNLGKSITVTSDADGFVNFALAIGRDAGFDDDGLVEAIVTATIGTATGNSDTEDVDFDSSDPLNGGTVDVVLSPASAQDGATNPAAPGQNVYFDLFTTDQFGNKVGGEAINVTVTPNKAGTFTQTGGSFVSDFDNNGDFFVVAFSPDTVKVDAAWTTGTFVYTTPVGDGNPMAGPNETLRDSATVVFANRTLAQPTLTGSPETTATPGQAVTETFTLKDTTGAAVEGATVTFTRSGAGGVETVTRTTNANGVATYVFTSNAEGLTTINAEATVNGSTQSASDTVTFDNGTTPPPPPPPAANTLQVQARTGQDRNGRIDIFRIVKAVDAQGDLANGATATLFKKVDGRNVRIKSKTLGIRSRATFRIRDLNKRKLTLYFAKVSRTSDTPAGVSPVKKVR